LISAGSLNRTSLRSRLIVFVRKKAGPNYGPAKLGEE
jgi:hypothetical protein